MNYHLTGQMAKFDIIFQHEVFKVLFLLIISVWLLFNLTKILGFYSYSVDTMITVHIIIKLALERRCIPSLYEQSLCKVWI